MLAIGNRELALFLRHLEQPVGRRALVEEALRRELERGADQGDHPETRNYGPLEEPGSKDSSRLLEPLRFLAQLLHALVARRAPPELEVDDPTSGDPEKDDPDDRPEDRVCFEERADRQGAHGTHQEEYAGDEEAADRLLEPLGVTPGNACLSRLHELVDRFAVRILFGEFTGDDLSELVDRGDHSDRVPLVLDRSVPEDLTDERDPGPEEIARERDHSDPEEHDEERRLHGKDLVPKKVENPDERPSSLDERPEKRKTERESNEHPASTKPEKNEGGQCGNEPEALPTEDRVPDEVDAVGEPLTSARVEQTVGDRAGGDDERLGPPRQGRGLDLEGGQDNLDIIHVPFDDLATIFVERQLGSREGVISAPLRFARRDRRRVLGRGQPATSLVGLLHLRERSEEVLDRRESILELVIGHLGNGIDDVLDVDRSALEQVFDLPERVGRHGHDQAKLTNLDHSTGERDEVPLARGGLRRIFDRLDRNLEGLLKEGAELLLRKGSALRTRSLDSFGEADDRTACEAPRTAHCEQREVSVEGVRSSEPRDDALDQERDEVDADGELSGWDVPEKVGDSLQDRPDHVRPDSAGGALDELLEVLEGRFRSGISGVVHEICERHGHGGLLVHLCTVLKLNSKGRLSPQLGDS